MVEQKALPLVRPSVIHGHRVRVVKERLQFHEETELHHSEGTELHLEPKGYPGGYRRISSRNSHPTYKMLRLTQSAIPEV